MKRALATVVALGVGLFGCVALSTTTAQVPAASTGAVRARTGVTVPGIPAVALNAVVRAADGPDACPGLTWWMLGAVFEQESDWGRFGGASIAANGDVRPVIRGTPIGWLGGAQAEGPAQFIPSSWSHFGRDGNGDLLRDPDNFYDASFAMAAHLCSSGGMDLSTEARQLAAYAGYYGADQDGYPASVLARGKRLASSAVIPVEPSLVAAAKLWVGRDFNPGEPAQCAFFVRQVLLDAGIPLGVTSATLDGWETNSGSANSFGADQGTVIRSVGELQPGDIVMFANTYGAWAPGTITHVGIYVGDNQMVDRPTASSPVKLRSINAFRFAGAIRLT